MRSFEAGEVVAGKYRLQKPLARGGMGAVWTGWNEQLEVPVAIKFMAAEALGSAELVARFEREAKSAAQLRSPHVVQIYEHGVHSGVPFMVMELLEGEDLSKRLKLRGRLSLDETARIVTGVCKALRRAEELKIVHRDLKPGNVFLVRSGDDEVVKVLDFGIAKIAHTTQGDATKTGALMGTPSYMSPEQARRTHHQVDHRSDLWSLGVIAFRAVTGKLPFAGDDAIDVLVRVVTTDAPPATSIAPDLPSRIDSFFARALSRDPDRRFQSAREFAEAFATVTSATGQHPRGTAWGSGAHPAVSSNALPNAFSPAPVAVASVPSGVPSRPSVHSPSGRAGAQTVPMADASEGAVTVPIQRSPVGQALLVQTSPPAHVAPVAPSPVTPPAASATGFGAPPGTSGQPQGDPLAARRAALQTQPLPNASVLAAEARVIVNNAPRETEVASADTSVGSEGTITHAAGELPVRKKTRTSPMVWVTLMVAFVAVGVVGAVIVSAVTSASEVTQEELVVFPTASAVSLTADPTLSALPATATATNLPTPSAAPGPGSSPTPGGAGSTAPTGQPAPSNLPTAATATPGASGSTKTLPSGAASTAAPKSTGPLPSKKMKDQSDILFDPIEPTVQKK